MDPFIIVMLVGMLGLMFFMQSRARKQQRERDAFRSTLVPGQRVMTQGGLIGTIVSIDEENNSVVLDSAGSLCEYMRAGIAKTLPDAVPGQVSAAAPASGLSAALANMAGAAVPAAVAQDDDLALLDSLAHEYHGTEPPLVNSTTIIADE